MNQCYSFKLEKNLQSRGPESWDRWSWKNHILLDKMRFREQNNWTHYEKCKEILSNKYLQPFCHIYAFQNITYALVGQIGLTVSEPFKVSGVCIYFTSPTSDSNTSITDEINFFDHLT